MKNSTRKIQITNLTHFMLPKYLCRAVIRNSHFYTIKYISILVTLLNKIKIRKIQHESS